MDALLSGYRRFRSEAWPDRRRLFEQLADRGQSPRALVICCSDSRVDPSMIFDASPGELFTIRNVANLVPPCQPDGAHHGTSAAIEFAVRSLDLRDILVMGHAMCGGVAALIHGVPAKLGEFVGPWMDLAARARNVLDCEAANPQHACELEIVRISLENLMTFPWIAEQVQDGSLRLHGAHFDIRSGILHWMQRDGEFAPA